MQWSPISEEKQKNELAHTEFRFTNTIIMGRQLPAVLRLYISVALQQKTGNFKVAPASRLMQWGVLTEGKRKNELANKTEVRFKKQ
jgi:glucose-6-phosphate dehydrogenase assembly protein OpcA